jgi:hypothetical protein
LHLAAEIGKKDVVRLLVELWPGGKGAVNNNGRTPLQKFAEGSRYNVELGNEEKEEICPLLGGQDCEVKNG